jgi:hypothetical protein
MKRVELPPNLQLKSEKWQGVDIRLRSGKILRNLLVEDGRWIVGELVGGQDGVRDLDEFSSEEIESVSPASGGKGLLGRLRGFLHKRE